ncbi:MAG: hypothetical protein AAGA96_18335 [Verrucomicrobiota bacterium]
MSEAVAEAPATSSDAPDSPENAAEAEKGSSAESGKQESSRMPAPDLLRRQMAHCGEYTYQALNKVGKLSPEDTSKISQSYLKVINKTPKGEAFQDSLTYLVMEGWKKEEIEARDVILELTRALLRYSKTKISHLAFAHQNETPIEFYNTFPAVSEICRLLGCPVIQVSEKDFITVTSINPFTATAAARLITNEIEADAGTKPFHFITTTDLNAWKYTCERHFGT